MALKDLRQKKVKISGYFAINYCSKKIEIVGK
jgi:hypothetical protein